MYPTHNYAFAAASLLKTITTDAETIKRWAILDSGATGHFLTTDAPALDITPTMTPITARLPNGDRVQSTHTCTLDLPSLPVNARAAHIIPVLASHSLISAVTLCNAGCNVNFTKIGCTISYRGRTLVCGHKCMRTGLWMIPLSETATAPTITSVAPTDNYMANVAATSSAAEYARYVHQLLCSPPAATLLQALAKSTELQTIPGLSPALIHNHLPRSTATDKGHMRRHRANTASTRNNQAAIVQARAEVDDIFPTHDACAVHDMFCFAALADANTGTMYTDLTGAFPVRSFKNMQYIFVAYVYDLNAIIVRPMPSHTDAAFITAFTDVFATLRARNYMPQLNVMDNECSKAVERPIRTKKLNIQLVPPHNHRVNAAERAIATFKEHFVAALATIDMNCPLQLWDEFLPQVELTLNLLRFSRRNPLISANNELYGPFDFGKTPLAPLETKNLIYDDPAVRASWAPHATDGYYVGPATDHYRCLRFYIPTTRRFRFADTWRLYPTHCQVPVLSEHDKTLLMANDFLRRIGEVVPTLAQDKIKHIETIRRLSEIMSGQPDPLSPTPPAPRVGDAAPPRVATIAPPRVATTAPPRVAPIAPPTATQPTAPRVATTSNTITAPATLRRLPRIHQRVTRANNPFEVLADGDDDDDTIVHSNSNHSPKQAVPNRMVSVLSSVPPPVHQRRSPNFPSNTPTTLVGPSVPVVMPTSARRVDPHPALHVPGPTIIPTPPRRKQNGRVPSTKLHTHFIVPDVPSPHDLRPVTFKRPRLSTCSPWPATNVIEPDEDRTYAPTLCSTAPPRRSTRLISPRRPGNISIQAINHVMRLNANKFTNHDQWTGPLIDIEDHCFGVVHPVTKETITQYKKLQHDPDLK